MTSYVPKLYLEIMRVYDSLVLSSNNVERGNRRQPGLITDPEQYFATYEEVVNEEYLEELKAVDSNAHNDLMNKISEYET